MSHLRRYPSYKKCAVPWIETIPAHWEVKPLKWLGSYQNSNIDKKSYEGQSSVRLCNYTDVYYNELLTDSLEFMVATASEAEIESMTLRVGDIIITKDSEDPTDIGIPAIVAEELTNVVCGYHLTVIRVPDKYQRFVHRYLQSEPTKARFYVESPGVTRYGLNQDAIGGLPVVLPPADEAEDLADYLDDETAHIDKLITKKERFIELLADKRRAIIANAVTKGLNPSVAMQDSGVDWIGQVPKHWAIRPLKWIASIGNGSTPSKDNLDYWTDGDIPWLNSSNVNLEEVTSANQFVTQKALDECHLPMVQPPAVLVGLTGQGKTRGLATTLLVEATINQHVAYVKPTTDEVEVGYLRRFFDAAYQSLRDDSEGAGSTKGAVTCAQLGDVRVPIPPVEEQKDIETWIKTATSRITSLIEKTERSIELLKERRTAIITAAVTGQIDLRESA